MFISFRTSLTCSRYVIGKRQIIIYLVAYLSLIILIIYLYDLVLSILWNQSKRFTFHYTLPGIYQSFTKINRSFIRNSCKSF